LFLCLQLPHYHPVYICILTHTCHMPRPSHTPSLITFTIFREECNCGIHHFHIFNIHLSLFFFLGSDIFLSTTFSSTLSLRSFSHATDQVLHSYRITDEIIVLCIVVFTPLDRKWEDKIFWNVRQLEFPLFVTSSCTQLRSVSDVPQCIFVTFEFRTVITHQQHPVTNRP